MSGKVARPPFVKFVVPTHGTRRPKHFVFHMTEGGGTIESLAAFFRAGSEQLGVNYITQPNGRMGSLGDFYAETYHVQSHNSECIGMEQIGNEHSRTWWNTLGRRQLWAGIWVAAWVHQELGIPLIRSAENRKWIAPSGFLQHNDCPDNDHTDCGPGFPFLEVLGAARRWSLNGVPLVVRAALPKR